MIRPSHLSSRITRFWLPLLIFASLCYSPIFLHLGNEPVKNFDESLFACRAFSIAYYGRVLCNFTDFTEMSGGKIKGPGASNTKPPLISFVQAFFFRLVGYNELALRLPIALSVVALLAVLVMLSYKLTASPVAGFLSGLVLVTSPGFMGVHVARTGDHDAPLALFGFVLLLSVYRYLDSGGQRRIYIYLASAMLICAALTKGVASLFFLPGIALYVLYKRQLGSLLRDRHFWLALGLFLLVAGGYNLYRELTCGSYFDRLWRYELGGHYAKTRDGHDHPWYWYFRNFYVTRLTYWLPALPIGIASLFLLRSRPVRDLGVLLLLAAASWMTVISGSQTKLSWYDASVYPILAWVVGWGLYQLYQAMRAWSPAGTEMGHYLRTGVFLLLFFTYPYIDILQRVYEPDELYWDEKYGYLMRQTERNLPELKSYHIFHIGQSTHALFYQLVYSLTKDYKVGRLRSLELPRVGMRLMMCQGDLQGAIEQQFETRLLQAYENCKLMELVRRKEEATGSP